MMKRTPLVMCLSLVSTATAWIPMMLPKLPMGCGSSRLSSSAQPATDAIDDDDSSSLARYRAKSLGGGPVQILAHKGGAGLMPENTVEAYRTAIALGVDVIDGDLAMTKDGILVIRHDQSLNPILTQIDGGYIPTSPLIPINSLTYEQVKQYDVGSIDPSSKYSLSFPAQRQLDNVHIPGLTEDVIPELLNTDVRLNVEIKVDLTDLKNPAYSDPTEVIETLVKDLTDAGITGRTEVQCFDWKVLEQLAEYPGAQDLTLSFISDGGYDVWLDWFSSAYVNGTTVNLDNYADECTKAVEAIAETTGMVCCWQPYYGLNEDYQSCCTEAMVDLAHTRGLPVVPWTLYDDADVPASYVPYTYELSNCTFDLLAKGVDGMLTNRPDIARGILTAHGLALPPPVMTDTTASCASRLREKRKSIRNKWLNRLM